MKFRYRPITLKTPLERLTDFSVWNSVEEY